MARSMEQLTAAALGAMNLQVLSLTAQCEKQQEQIADLTAKLEAATPKDEAKGRTLKAAG